MADPELTLDARTEAAPASRLEIHGLRVGIGGDWPEVIDGLERDFAWFATEPAGGEPQVRVQIARRKPQLERFGTIPQAFITTRNTVFQDAARTIVDYSGRVVAVYDRVREHLLVEGEDPELVHEAAYLFLLSRIGRHLDDSRLMRIHALGLSGAQGAVLVLLPSGGGKTTLALRALRDPRVKLLSEDTPVLDRSGMVHPFPLRIGVNPSDAELLPDGQVRRIERLEYGPKLVLSIDAVSDRIEARPQPLRHLVVARRWLNGARLAVGAAPAGAGRPAAARRGCRRRRGADDRVRTAPRLARFPWSGRGGRRARAVLCARAVGSASMAAGAQPRSRAQLGGARAAAQMSPDAPGRRIARWALRTGAGPARPLWWLAHRAAIGIVARRLTASSPGCRVYLKGGFGYGRPVYGLSDIDAIVVARDDAGRERVQRRWRALAGRWPMLDDLFQVWVYTADDVRALSRDPYLTFGLGASPPAAAFLGPDHPQDRMALVQRPGLYGAGRDWRALGARRRPPTPIGLRERQTRELHAWLELRFLWEYAFLLCVGAIGASATYNAAKLIADSARIWLWLRFGEVVHDRDRLLERALDLMPEERESLRRAAKLSGDARRLSRPSLEEPLAFLVRTSERIARRLECSARPAGALEVRLVWGGATELSLDQSTAARVQRIALGPSQPLPLADWRARALPGLLDVALAPAAGAVADPARLGQLARASKEDLLFALRSSRLLVLPTTEVWHRGRLRGIECACSDPVSFALLDGASVARFPHLPGWSAADCARRALAEHRGWLSLPADRRAAELPYWMTPPYHPELVQLCGLLNAARAALFAHSVTIGQPELPLSAAAITRSLAEHAERLRGVAEAAAEELARCRPQRSAPDARVVAALHAAVASLPAFATGPGGRGLA